MSSTPVSILILTQDEEANLPRCLDAIGWCDDIVVIDSGSTDQTITIAQAAGCRVITRPFDNFAEQRNYGLEKAAFRHPWVLHLDADEVMTPELLEEIEKVLETTTLDAYRIPSKTMFMGKWLRYAGMYPVYQVRLTRLGAFRFKQIGHGQKADIEANQIGTLNHAYLHYSFSKGLDDWFAKHNRYSTDEAHEALSGLSSGKIDLGKLFSSNAAIRRATIKKLSYRLPFRSWLRFFYMFFFCQGFLDGKAGLAYCQLLAIYEKMIDLKMKELKNI